jgi:hypothetical protein
MPSSNYISQANPSPAVEVDPTAPGTFIRYAMAIEGTLNILAGVPMLFYPSIFLSLMAKSPAVYTSVSPSTAMFQWIGALILGITPQLFLALPNTRRAIESRRMVYISLGAGELALIPLFLWQASRDSGFTSTALGNAVVMLAPALLFRGYVLFVKPSLMGRYRDVVKKE